MLSAHVTSKERALSTSSYGAGDHVGRPAVLNVQMKRKLQQLLPVLEPTPYNLSFKEQYKVKKYIKFILWSFVP
jgi:hypothetical protein